MFKDIDADCFLMVDGDDTYPAKYAKKMCDYIFKNKVDMVIGNRLLDKQFKNKTKRFHYFGNKLVSKLVNLMFHSNVRDIMSGYRALSPKFVKSFPANSSGFNIETEMTIYALNNNFLIKEISIEYKNRPDGSYSKLNTYKDGFKVLKRLFSSFIKYKIFVFILFYFLK